MEGGGDALVWTVALVCLVLLPVASRIIAGVGEEISAELDGGRTGSELRRHLDRTHARSRMGEAALREEEIRQLVAARSYLRRGRGEEDLDTAAEVTRIEAEIEGRERRGSG